jgi:hypothetical protein
MLDRIDSILPPDVIAKFPTFKMSIIRSDNLKLLLIENIVNNHISKFSFYRYDSGTRYPYAYKVPKLRHSLHSSFEKSIIERSIQYFKDRKEYLMTIILADI